MKHHFFSPITVALVIVLALIQSGYSQTITWTGATDTDWHKKCNWNPNTRVPNCSDDVSVPNTTNKPSITGVAHCRTINIATTSGAIVNLNSSGSGRLHISSLNGGACAGTAADNGGCVDPCDSPPVGCLTCPDNYRCCEPCIDCGGPTGYCSFGFCAQNSPFWELCP